MDTPAQDIIKQVIVMRDDLGMRKGKMIAQGAHASMAWVSKKIQSADMHNAGFPDTIRHIHLSDVEMSWIDDKFTKICVRASGPEFDALEEAAKKVGVSCHRIVDIGKTEFNGVPTLTCMAIGPDYSSKIDPITGHLKLF